MLASQAVTTAHTPESPRASGRRLHIRESQRESPDRQPNRLPGLTADWKVLRRLCSQTGSVSSLFAPEATDCLQVGPGLPPKWPYRLVPDRSGPIKVGEHVPLFNSDFSMARSRVIAAIALTRTIRECAKRGLPQGTARLGNPHEPCYPPSARQAEGLT